MRINRATLRDFRNLSSAELSLETQFTALVGPNGQGKTNTLEALYFALALRPLRNVPRRALVRAGAEAARIEIDLTRRTTGLRHALSVELAGRSRTLRRDEKKVDARTYLQSGVAVTFSPDDLALGKGSPERRRRFLDRALLNAYPGHLDRALRYQRALKERNRLLSTGGSGPQLEAYDEILSRVGAAIVRARAQLVADLAPRVRAHFAAIADPAPALSLRYTPSLSDVDVCADESTLVEAYRQALLGRRSLDRRRGSTTLGPHLDDVEFTFDGHPLKERASQGQFRALALALKLAELRHAAEVWGEPPILLLDDMSSELDRGRSRQLFDTVTHLDGQVVLTSTDSPEDLRRTLDLADPLLVWTVEGGQLARHVSP
jgi:DNA replication and repair protein RecF